jgi:hypothetical protein
MFSVVDVEMGERCALGITNPSDIIFCYWALNFEPWVGRLYGAARPVLSGFGFAHFIDVSKSRSLNDNMDFVIDARIVSHIALSSGRNCREFWHEFSILATTIFNTNKLRVIGTGIQIFKS